MRIDSKTILAGRSICDIRRLLRRCKDLNWDIGFPKEVLGIGVFEAKKILRTLEKLGYIEKISYSNKNQYWSNTVKGNALALATTAQPISRESAEKKVQEFLQRVYRVKDDPYYLYEVAEVILFGSYLTSAKKLNDIDIAVRIIPKEKNSSTQEILNQKRIKEAIQKGRRFSNFLEELSWPQTEVLRFLKFRSRSISLHHIDDPTKLKHAKTKVLYKNTREQ